MNLILATHAKPVLAHKAPTICPTFLYQSIQASALPQPYPIAHVNALQGKIQTGKKEDNAKEKEEEKKKRMLTGN